MYQECSEHNDWAIPTKQHHTTCESTNPRFTATSTESNNCLLKLTWKVAIICPWKQPKLATESKPALAVYSNPVFATESCQHWLLKASQHWPLKASQKASQHWPLKVSRHWALKAACICRRKHSHLLQLHQVVIGSQSSGWKKMSLQTVA